jgi:hypothetical protein
VIETARPGDAADIGADGGGQILGSADRAVGGATTTTYSGVMSAIVTLELLAMIAPAIT